MPRAISLRDSHIWSLRILCLLLLLLLCLMIIALLRYQRDIVVHLPPDINGSAVLRSGDIPPSNIYSFAFSVFQNLNHWPDDEGDNYLENITKHQCLVTPYFLRWLYADFKRKQNQGELNRSRGFFPLGGYRPEYVKSLTPNTWEVILDLALREWVHNRIVKDTKLRYVLRVVRFDISKACNPWGLALDEHTQPVVRL